MKKIFLIPFILIFVVSCGDAQKDSIIKDNAAAAETFIYLVLNEPDEAKKLMHEDFRFRYIWNIWRSYKNHRMARANKTKAKK